MKPTLGRTLLVGAFVATLAVPCWAADQSQNAEPKQEKTMSNQSHDEVKKIQEALKSKGDDPGKIDGVMGRKTKDAISAFQKANGLKATGAVNHETAEKLGVELTSASGKQEKK
jgi:peptidoglycan hydrolase-like protein with peptidoglycan-binding domain